MARSKQQAAYKIPAEVKDAYVNNHIALGIGAGLSQGSKLPVWDDLVCRVADLMPGVGKATAKALLADGFDAIAVATYLRAQAGSDRDFAEAVRKALYLKFNPASEDDPEFARHIRKTNPVLHAVGTMCAIDKGGEFAPNPKLRAILTLNVDCLLEEYTRARFKKRVLRAVERAAAGASSHRIHSYHVHGFLVRGTSSADLRRVSPDRLVFTEQQYFDAVADANGFINYTLLYLFREYRFLFVGLSMSDNNLRRALHLSYRERLRELEAEGETSSDAHLGACRHWALLKRENKISDGAREKMLEALGVRTIWLKEFDQIPSVLRALYECDPRWSDVA